MLETPTCHFETCSLNITVYLQYLLYHIDSIYIFSVHHNRFFKISLNSSRSLKQISAEILLDNTVFVLETATHSTLARFTGYLICQTFSFSIFNSLTEVWFDFSKFILALWFGEYSLAHPMKQKKITDALRWQNAFLPLAAFHFLVCFSYSFGFKDLQGVIWVRVFLHFLTLCLFALVWLQGGMHY